MKKTTRLRELIEQKDILVLPGAFSPWSAKILEVAGFEACYMSGGHTSRHIYGLPDAGLVTMSEMIANAAYMVEATTIPLVADADTGYGNAINVRRTVQAFIRAGVAGIHIEDQVSPKRCGFVAGKEIISMEEAVGKYRAAVDAKRELDEDFVLIARTDARGAPGGGMAEAIRRSNAYHEAGVDLIYFEGPQSVEEIREVRASVPGPLMVTCTAIDPFPAVEELQSLGMAIAFFPIALGIAANKAIWDFAVDFKQRGAIAEAELRGSMSGHPLANYHEFSGFPDLRRLEEKYLSADEVTRRYDNSIGYKPK
ncbi:MAG: isocitrate lyase/PEP mutase family protein [Dehalococcoidia bacterium]|nr:isocitrate lyase/PEP mutase family protein [Dehalococcoidia bacterium]